MKGLIVYDSVFGNTGQVAQAMGDALRSQGADFSVLKVDDVKPEDLSGLKWLIVGSPTRKFTSTPATKDFLAKIPRQALKGVRVSAFDTRVDVSEVNSSVLTFFVKLFGYAAEPIAKGLIKKGGEPGLAPEGFIVEGAEGPMRNGELERAADWAKQALAAK